MKQIGLLFLAWLGAAQLVSAAPCVPGTLASYIALGAGGCTIGTNVLANFTQGSALNGAVNIPLAGLNVFPAGGASNPGIIVTGNITAGSGQVFSALINYTITGSTYTSDTVTLSNTTATGNGAVTDIQNFCLNGDFQAPYVRLWVPGGEGPGSPLVVLGNGSATASLNATSLGITHNLEIDSGITGTASGAVIIDQFGTSGASSQNIGDQRFGRQLVADRGSELDRGRFWNGLHNHHVGRHFAAPACQSGRHRRSPLQTAPAPPRLRLFSWFPPARSTIWFRQIWRPELRRSTSRRGGSTYTGTLQIANVAPAIFTADGSGSGPPAAQVVRVSNGVESFDPAPFTRRDERNTRYTGADQT